MGFHDDISMTFGKYGPGADHRTIGRTPTSYLRWCLEQDWFERRYEDLVGLFEEELAWRTHWGKNFEDEREITY